MDKVVVRKKKNMSAPNVIFVICNTIFMIAFVVITLYPIINTLAISFNNGTDALRGGVYLWPRVWTLKNYTTVLQKDNLITGAYITVARTVIGTVLSLVANAILAFIVAVIVFPLLVILGMHDKLFLKGFYNKYEGEKFKAFTKKYTYVGIGLYALVAIMVLVDNIFKLYALTGPAFGILFLGGIAYFVVSLALIKKNFAPEGEKINVIETIKENFKKEEKKK